MQAIEIKTNKRKRCVVSYKGANGEILATSEVLNSNENADKNIIAMMNLFGTIGGIEVYDGKSKYMLLTNGSKLDIRTSENNSSTKKEK